MTVTIADYKGVEIEVQGNHHKAWKSEDYDVQPEPERFEINKVFYNGSDVTALVGYFYDFHDLERKILDEITE